MKKSLIALFSIVCISALIVISCQRETSSNETSKVLELKTGTPLKSSAQNSGSTNRAPVDVTLGQCNCNNHGGTIGGGISWHLATCRSNCQRGIGFRCGREGYLNCQDGTVIICSSIINCASVAKGVNPSRDMDATYTIYDNGTMKLVFNKAIPVIEKESSTGDVFEVETTDFLSFSSPIAVDNITYAGIDIKQGNYKINYADGTYGSVVIAIELKQ